MPLQRYNDQNIDLLASVFQRRREPNFAAGMSSVGTMTPNILGFWPFSSADQISVADISGQGRIMAILGGFSLTQVSARLAQYGTFDGVNGYLKRPSEPETAMTDALSVGAWVNFGASGADQGIIGKWYTTGNQRGWRIYRSAANAIVFEVSADGTATTSVTSAVVAGSAWTFVSGVYLPSTSIKVGIGRTKVSNTTAIPASIFASVEALEFGRTNRSNYMTGDMALAFLANSSSDSMVDVIYEQTRDLFGV